MIPNFSTEKLAPKGFRDKIREGFCRLWKVIPDFATHNLMREKFGMTPQSRENSTRVFPRGPSLSLRGGFCTAKSGMSPKVAKFIATFFYIGYFPVAPGTLATVAGALIAFCFRFNISAYLFVMLIVTAIGFFAAHEAEKAIGKKDPGCIVIDEVAGVMISFFMLPMYWPVILTGFFLFRAFDMFKVPPADKFEAMGGGAGIMLDDIMAGVYTNVTLQIALRLSGGA